MNGSRSSRSARVSGACSVMAASVSSTFRVRLGSSYGNRRVTVAVRLPKGIRMKHYETTTSIAAPPEAVWAVLTDAAAWPSWDSGVTAVEGRIAEGKKITVRRVRPGAHSP